MYPCVCDILWQRCLVDKNCQDINDAVFILLAKKKITNQKITMNRHIHHQNRLFFYWWISFDVGDNSKLIYKLYFGWHKQLFNLCNEFIKTKFISYNQRQNWHWNTTKCWCHKCSVSRLPSSSRRMDVIQSLFSADIRTAPNDTADLILYSFCRQRILSETWLSKKRL